MPNIACCPSHQALQQFVLGQLSVSDIERIEQHLNHCGRCLALLDQLGSRDSLVDAAREQAVTPVPLETEGVRELMDHLQAQPPAAASEGTAAFLTSIALPGNENSIAPPSAAAPPSKDKPVRYDFLAPPERADEIGRLGPYRILEVLGAGGMGVVFRAESLQLERPAALKVMLPSLAANASARERFLREARAAATLEHDHIVTIYEVGEDRGVPFLAMRLLHGESLDSRLHHQHILPFAEVLRIGREAALGLAAAHACGLVHRDIKPANLWLEGKRGQVKILDFGLARSVRESIHLTQSGLILGTPAYMAPEQSRAAATIDHRADLFSLGCVLYRCCTGQLPFSGSDTISILAALALDEPRPPRQLNAEVPPDFSRLIMQLLAKEPPARSPSAQAVVEAITALESGRFGKNREDADDTEMLELPATHAVPATARQRRRRMLAFVAAGFLAVLVPLAYWCGSLVLRVATDNGQLVIESDDPDVEVRVKRNGEQVTLLDTRTNKEITLRAGAYQLELVGGKDGLILSTNQFTLHRGAREVVKVRLENAVEIRRFTAGAGMVPNPVQWDDVFGIALAPDGRLFSSGEKGILHQWDFATGKVRKQWQLGNSITHVSLTPDHRFVLCGIMKTGWNGFVLFDPNSGKEVQRFPGRQTWPTDAVFSPDGRQMITTGQGSLLTVWDVADGSRVRAIATPLWVTRMTASADFRWALSCSQWKTTAWLWDIASGKPGPTLKGHGDGIVSLALSPDGRRALTGSKDKTVRLWDVQNGKELQRFEGHTDTVSSVAFSPDGRRILSGGADRTLRLWDVESARELCCSKGHTGKITTVRFTHDGRQAISGSIDQTIRLWRLPDLPAASGGR